MKFSRNPSHKRDASTLTLKLWDFTGTAMLNLFMFLFVVAYLSPLAFMVIAVPHPGGEIPFLSANCHHHDSEQHYAGSDLLPVQRPHAELDWDLASHDRPTLLWKRDIDLPAPSKFQEYPARP